MKSKNRPKYTALENGNGRHYEQIEVQENLVVLKHIISKRNIKIKKEELSDSTKWKKGWISLK